jgi:hypothetical protein
MATFLFNGMPIPFCGNFQGVDGGGTLEEHTLDGCGTGGEDFFNRTLNSVTWT